MAAAVTRSKGANHEMMSSCDRDPTSGCDVVEERRKNEDGQVVLHRYLKGKLLGKVWKAFIDVLSTKA